jgi:hypothetical protein
MAPQFASQSQLSARENTNEPPPIILVSTSENAQDFKGVDLAKAGLSNSQLRVDNQKEVKNMINRQQG